MSTVMTRGSKATRSMKNEAGLAVVPHWQSCRDGLPPYIVWAVTVTT